MSKLRRSGFILAAAMRHWLGVTLIVVLSGVLASCSKSSSTGQPGPYATVSLRDGTTVSGTVTNSSPSQITLTTDDNNTRILDMKNVKSVDYGEAPAAQAEKENPSAPAAPEARAPRRVRPEPATPPRYHPEEATIRTKTRELPTGTQLEIRTDETIDSSKAAEGQTYAAEVSKDVLDSSGDVVIPRGSNAQIVIRSASSGGRITGNADLVLDLQSVSVDGRLYELDTSDVRQKGHQGLGKNKRTGEMVGGGAAIGAIIGAIAGHGKGAAIGAASGAAAGAATQVLTKGRSIRVPAESILTFQLEKPLHVTPARQ